jgi:hypothetical protein
MPFRNLRPPSPRGNLAWRIYSRGPTFGIMPQVTAWAKSKGSLVYFIDALLRGLGQVRFPCMWGAARPLSMRFHVWNLAPDRIHF